MEYHDRRINFSQRDRTTLGCTRWRFVYNKRDGYGVTVSLLVEETLFVDLVSSYA